MTVLQEDEDLDWIDIERPLKAGVVLPDVTVRITKKAEKPARAYLTLRGDVFKWSKSVTRFRCQIGGADANLIRVLPDDAGGRFEAALVCGGHSKLIRLGAVAAWPDEPRDITECLWRLSDGALILTLPSGWAKPRVSPKASSAEAMPQRPIKAQPFPVTTAAPGLASIVAERDELVERLRQKEEDEAKLRVPATLGSERLAPLERTLLSLLLSRDLVTKAAFLLATAADAADDTRDEKICDVTVSKLRPKLATAGVEIATTWGEGYSISRLHRSVLRKLFGWPEVRPNVVPIGEPEPGRSALDQRRVAK